MAPLRKLTSESDAEASRKLSMPEVTAGKEIPAISPMIVTTISISTSVTPRGTGILACAPFTECMRSTTDRSSMDFAKPAENRIALDVPNCSVQFVLGF